MAFVFIMVMWLQFLALHEYAHARVAYAGGDTTVADKGYLTLNPFRFTNFTMSILFPLLFLMIGGIPLPGGCVYIDKTRLRSKHWEALVSAAGVGAQIAALPLLLLPIWLGFVDPDVEFWNWYEFFVFILIYCVVLNLLPVPPLDGYGIIEPYLPRAVQKLGDSVKPFGIFIVLVLVWTSSKAGLGLLDGAAVMGGVALGLDFDLIVKGAKAMQSF